MVNLRPTVFVKLLKNSYFETEYDTYNGVTPTYTSSDEATLFANFSNALVDSNNAQIILSQSKDIIMVGETTTITGLFLDANNYPIPNAYIVFKIGETAFSSITDSNGKATFVYTGTGQGKVTVTGYYDEAVSSSPITLYDCLQVDRGTTSDHNDIWTDPFEEGTLTRNTNYTSITSEEGSDSFRFSIPAHCIVEVDVYCSSATGYFMDIAGMGNALVKLNDLGSNLASTWIPLKIILDTRNAQDVDGVIINKNTNESTIIPIDYVASRFEFVYDSQYEIRFRNFRVYTDDTDIDLTITGDEIIQSGSTANIVPALSAPLSAGAGKKISYLIKKGTEIVQNGVATTNSNGEANIQYVGSGLGELDVECKYRSLLQETYGIYDCLWFDTGTDSSNNVFISSSTMTVTYGSEYCTLTETTSGTTGNIATNNSHFLHDGDIIEFDFMQVDGTKNNSPIYIRNRANGSSLVYFNLSNINQEINTWIHLKLHLTDETLYVYVDDNQTPLERTMSNTDTDYRLYFSTASEITTLKYKNLKVYPA